MTNVDVNQLYIDVQKQGLVSALYNVFGDLFFCTFAKTF